MGGCSDDSFDYFRAWLIAQGKDVFESAIRDPETLIPTLEKLEEGEYPEREDLLFVACIAYVKKTGLDEEHYYDLFEQVTKGQYDCPSIEFDWDENDEERLKRKFPKLWERFGENPIF
jgi:hypothetical protein